MRYVPRLIEQEPLTAARHFPALILTGPRRAGKTTLLRRAFLSELRPPVILDEIQNTSEILNYVRAAIFQLLPLAAAESAKVSLLNGGFPEVVSRPAAAQTWFRSYVQTYLERDVRAISSIRDLAAPLGISVPTVTEWLGILETTGEILLVPPFHENLGKR